MYNLSYKKSFRGESKIGLSNQKVTEPQTLEKPTSEFLIVAAFVLSAKYEISSLYVKNGYS